MTTEKNKSTTQTVAIVNCERSEHTLAKGDRPEHFSAPNSLHQAPVDLRWALSLERAAHGGVRSCSRCMHHVLLHLYVDINVLLLKVLYTRNSEFDANHYTVGIDY